MTEQDSEDLIAWQTTPAGNTFALVHELERVTQALAAIANDDATVDLLLPELISLHLATRRLAQIYAAATLTRIGS